MKNKKRTDPFKYLVLDEEEAQIERDLEKGLYEEALDFKQTKMMLKDAAERYQQLNKTKSITLRVNQLDLIKVKAAAKRRNIPYQTLLSALINQYAQGETKLVL